MKEKLVLVVLYVSADVNGRLIRFLHTKINQTIIII